MHSQSMQPPSGERPRSVLIVDDSRAIQAIMRRALEQSNALPPLNIRTASSAEQAQALVEDETPDLLLSDWHMPGMDGAALLRWLRRHGHGGLPIGVITTETRSDQLDRARELGASFVLNKPFDDVSLCQAVGEALSRPMAAPADIMHVPDLPRGAALESLAQLQQQTYMHIGTRGFELLRAEPDARLAEREQQLVALYGSTQRGGLYALGLLDTAACWLIGGAASGLSSAEIQAGITAGTEPSARVVDQAGRLLQACAPLLRKRSPTDQVALSAARLVRQRFDKLPELLQQHQGRSEFTLRIKSLGQGRLSFLLV